MRRRVVAGWSAAGAVALVLGVAGVTPAGADAAPTTTLPAATPVSGPVFYLAIGASDSLGYQPSSTSPHGQPTDHGYANDLVAGQAALGVTMQLTELGCAGATTFEVINGGDHCYHNGDSQLSDAVAFLRGHAQERGLVTIDLGFNDVRPCLFKGQATASCVSRHLTDLANQLGVIVSTLMAAAGPQVTFVGLNHFNPLLAGSVGGFRNAVDAAVSSSAIDRMNDTLADTYARFGVAVARVTRAFDQGNTAPVVLAGVGTVSAEVARVCELTWMCQARPLGPNIHPNDLGYQAIAEAIAAVLGPAWAGA